jgi:hypothetical protein
MRLPQSLTTVTLFSKTLAGIIFTVFVFVAFLMGTKYQAGVDLIRYQQFNLVTAKPSPTPTCRPRPACLDSIPRCLIPETSDMCPKAIPDPKGSQTACTMEAKLCPDGKTYVSRTGPNCEFSPCP